MSEQSDEQVTCAACASDQAGSRSDFTCTDHPRRPTDQTPETVVMLSGGKGSWAAARYLIDTDRVDPERMVLLFCDTNGEDPDLYRFLHECADNLEAPLIVLDNDGRTIWDVFRKERMIGNTRLSVCSRALKQRPARAWLDEHAGPNTAVVVGIDWTESHRLPAIERSYAPLRVLAPLTELGSWTRERVDTELADALIEPPRLYAQGFPHNNCAGACVRAGQGQWAMLLRTNPERYAAEEAQENAFRAEVGKDVSILRDRRGGTTTPLTLTRFRERLTDQPDLFDPEDVGGCGCMSLPDDEAQTPEQKARFDDLMDAANLATEQYEELIADDVRIRPGQEADQ